MLNSSSDAMTSAAAATQADTPKKRRRNIADEVLTAYFAKAVTGASHHVSINSGRCACISTNLVPILADKLVRLQTRRRRRRTRACATTRRCARASSTTTSCRTTRRSRARAPGRTTSRARRARPPRSRCATSTTYRWPPASGRPTVRLATSVVIIHLRWRRLDTMVEGRQQAHEHVDSRF